ncbi:glycosyltransferase family protein [Marisediminicola senii]|uniref:glycosyltransferase family protein n=1 Tax=Marisediminicola senii TaxID=2711233 RepID=UPI0013E9A34B|nr:glycosyltransferase [Marisediminicola senii]
MVIRVVLYSHDSVGLGHVRRNLAIAHALTETLPALTGESVSGLLVTGQPSATSFPTAPGWDWLVLPGITPGSAGYEPRHLSVGMTALSSIRANVIRVALREFSPDLVIVDRHPLGAHGELEAALTALRTARPDCAIVLGLREVLDKPSVARAEWKAIGGAATVRRLFDAVWLYGDPAVHDAATTGELPRAIAALAEHTGYLSNGRPVGRPSRRARREEPFVLTMVGGGADGGFLATAAAQAEVPEGYRHLIVLGPQMPDAHRREVRALAKPGTSVLRTVPDGLALLRQASAVVCMGGYNSISEVLSTTVPALVVPRVARRQEQAIRAQALARVGAIDAAGPATVTPESLGAWFAANAGRTVHRDGIDRDGLRAVGTLAGTLLTERRAMTEGEARHAV